MISFCLRKGALSYRSVCHSDWNQDRILLLFYKKNNSSVYCRRRAYEDNEPGIQQVRRTLCERLTVKKDQTVDKVNFRKLWPMKRLAHLQYPQIDREISWLLVGHLLHQWFYQWLYVLGQRIKVFLGYKSDRSCLRSTSQDEITCFHIL